MLYLFLLIFLYVYYRHSRFISFGQDLLFMAGLVVGNEYGYGMAYWLNYVRTVGFPFGFQRRGLANEQ